MPSLDPVSRDAISISKIIVRLSPKDIAELRRADKTGCAAFWRIASNFPETVGRSPYRWIYIIAALAELSQGADGRSAYMHNFKSPLGKLLATGGLQTDGKIKNPVLSEFRLAHLARTRGSQRCQQFLRVLKMVKSKSRPPYQINACELAWAMLDDKSGHPERKISREYYRHVL